MRKHNGIWVDAHTFMELPADTTKPLSGEIATRERSIDFTSLGMYLPNPDPILKKLGKNITIYKELLSDGHVSGCVSSRKAGVKALKWEIDRGKAKTKSAKAITECFKRLPVDNIISEILDATLYGFQALEVMWEQRDGYWLPKAIVGKPAHWFVFGPDSVLRFRTKQNMLNGEELPPRKFLLAQHGASYEDPYGIGELSRCFWPITFKRGGMKFWAIFIEKYGMPFMLGKLPRGLPETEYDDLADKLDGLVQDAVGVIPNDASVEVVGASSGAASSDIYERFIDVCKAEVSIALLGQNLTTEVKDGGSYAATQGHMAVRGDIIDGDRKIVAAVMNQLIDWICELNFADGERPEFTLYAEEDVDKALADRDKTISETGVRFTKVYYQRAYGLADDEFEIATPSQQTPGGPYAQFSEGTATPTYPDQSAIDAAISKLDPAAMKTQMNGALTPIIDLLNAGEAYEEILSSLAAAYPKMNTDSLQEMLARAIFVSEIWGKLNA